MPTYNYKSRELIAKIVYYGPGRCGKTTNLQQIHARMRPETRSELLSVATETDRTIYFDLLPLNLGTISGMKFMVRLFTVPGQVYYAETRKLVLRGADAVVFVADSQDHMMDENRQSLRDLKDNLAANGLEYSNMPLILQWNKRDLSHLIPEAELDATLNDRGARTLSAIASQGVGVLETLRAVTLEVFNHIKAGGKTASAPPRPASVSSGPTTRSPAPMGPPSGSVPRAPSTSAAPIASIPLASAPASPAAPEVGRVKPGSWMASMPKTSLDSPAPGPGSSKGTRPVSASGPSRPAPPPPPVADDLGPPLRPDGPQPVKISSDMVLEEFRNLALVQSQMAERLAALEAEMSRLGRESEELREMLARQDHA